MLEKPSREELFLAILKGTIGGIPVAGSLIAEVLSTTIPDKRYQRLESMLSALVEKVAMLDSGVLAQKLTNDHAIGILEDGMFQGARAVTEERRKRIASVVGNALSSEESKYQESKRLLGLLEQLNDVELKVLYGHHFQKEHERNAYFAQHPDAERPPLTDISEASLRPQAMYNAYLAHLAQLGLLDPQYRTPELAGLAMSEIAKAAARPPEIVDHSVSVLGTMLLESVDLLERAG